MSTLKIYSGKEPYIFISYAHKDSDIVLPLVSAMQEIGYRIWLDLGIEAGTEWSNNIAAHLRDCEVFVSFISKNSVNSENCLDEIAYAKSHQKTSLMIYLEENVILPEGTEMQTARFQRMYYTRQKSLDEFIDNFSALEIFNACREEQATSVPSPKPLTPVTVNQTETKKTKKSRTPLITALSLLLAALLGLGSYFIFKPSSSDTLTALSENPMDYTIELDKVVYQLPFEFDKLTNNGWKISTKSITKSAKIIGHGEVEITMAKDEQKVTIGIFNPSGNAQKVKDCMINKVSFCAYDICDFKLAKNINFSSNVEKIIAAYGEPNSHDIESDYEVLRYYDSEDNDLLKFFIYSEDMAEYSDISLEVSVPFEKTETNDTEPEFLDDYKGPSSFSDDILTGQFKTYGKTYVLPVPVKYLLADGWKFTGKPNSIPAGNTDYASLTKEDLTLSISLINCAQYQTIAENCVITSVTVSKEGDFELPGGIKIGTSIDTLDTSLANKCEKYESTYNVRYSHYEYDERDFSVYISAETNKNAVTYISLENETWDY